MSLDIRRGTQKPPQKNWNQRRPKERFMVLTKGNGKAMIAPKDIMEAATGKALGLSKPPSLAKAIPPIATPATGPVIAHIAKYTFVVSFGSFNTMFQ